MSHDATNATPTFLVERYWPRRSVEDLLAADRALRRCARSLSAAGRTVRVLGTTFLPDDETVFGRFEATDAATVEELHRMAGVTVDCVVPSIEVPADGEGTAGP